MFQALFLQERDARGDMKAHQKENKATAPSIAVRERKSKNPENREPPNQRRQ